MKQKAPVYAILAVTLLITAWFAWKVKQRLSMPPVDPQIVTSEPSLTLRAAYVPGELPATPESPAWDRAEPVDVPVNFQVLALPWNRTNKPPLRVRVTHNAERISFLLEWLDSTENRQSGEPQRFADAAAIMFPLKVEQPVTLMMGFLGPAEIWHWRADWDQKFWAAAPERRAYADFYPFDDDPAFHPAKAAGNFRALAKPPSAVEMLLAEGPGTVRSKPHQSAGGRGRWADGRWQVVVSRRLAPEAPEDYAFPSESGRRRIAFALWDGAQDERGARKSISEWVWLELGKPPARTAAAIEPGAARR